MAAWRRAVIGLGVCAALLGSALPARADAVVPQICDPEGRECQSCWEHYGDSPEDKATFDECRKPLLAKGYTEACRSNKGAGDDVLFCAPGERPDKVTKGGGCAGCSIDSGTSANALLGLSLGLALLSVRRRRTPR